MSHEQRELVELFKAKFPQYPDVIDLIIAPVEQRQAVMLAQMNAALKAEGLAPFDKILTPEEAQAQFQDLLRPKHPRLNRFRRAWAILWGKEE